MMKTLAIAIGALLMVFTSVAQTISEETVQVINERIDGLIQAGEPGLAVGLVKNGEIIYERYAGLANLSHNIPIDHNSRFNIASVAKQFTALAVWKLAKESKIDLEADFRNYLTGYYPDITSVIRVRHLINHTSGIRDFYDLMSLSRNPWWRREGLDNEDALQLLKQQQELNFEPGSEYLYSNSNYTLLATLVAQVSGQTFLAYSKGMFESLGMNATHFLEDYMYVIPNQALPYADWGDGRWQQYPMMTNLHGDGFLFTTLRDQLKFEQVLQTSGNEIAGSQGPIENAEISSYGFGLELEDRMGRKAVHHSGGTGAYHAQTVRYTDENLSIVVMSNNSKLWSGYVADEMAKLVIEKQPAKAEDRTLSGDDATMTQSEIIGAYSSPEGSIIRIFEEENVLFWQQANNNPRKLENIKGNLFQWESLPDLKIGFDTKGFIVYYPGSEDRFHQKMAAFAPNQNYKLDFIGIYQSSELDLRFEISLNESGELMLFQKEMKTPRKLEILQKDAFLLSDYQFKPDRDETGYVSALRLTFSRLKNVRFDRINSNEALARRFTEDGGMIQVTTVGGTGTGSPTDALLTRNDSEGNEIWFKRFGRKAWDTPKQVIICDDGGYLILGSTSSLGKGNYDVWLVKTDDLGKKQWEKSFGTEDNEYGRSVMQIEDGSFLIQAATDTDVHPDSTWIINYDPSNP